MTFYESSWEDFININRKNKNIRAGIIPMFIQDGETYCIMTRKTDKKISDFSEGFNVRINESAYVCEVREANEEGGSFIMDIIKDIMSLDQYVQYGDDYYEPHVIVRVGAFNTWFILLPVPINIEKFMIDEMKFVPNKEISRIELLSYKEITQISNKGMSKIFDPSIVNFMCYLFNK